MCLIKRIWYKIRGERSLTIYEQSDLLITALRNNGAKIGNNVTIINSEIDANNRYLIEIGNDVLITGSTVLTHDACMLKSTGYIKIGKVVIGNNVFVSKGCMILPNTTIGDNVIVGAGVIVAKDVPSNVVIVGNPWRVLCSYDEMIAKHKKIMEDAIVVTSEEYREDKLKNAVKEKGFCYIKKW